MEYPRLYVLTRNDLDPAYAAVQAGHAVAEWALHYWDGRWQNNTLIYLGVHDVKSLLKWKEKLEMKDVTYKLFCEPDIGNEPTALAVCSYDESTSKLFQKLKLK